MKKTRIVAVIFWVWLGMASLSEPALADNWSWDTGVQTIDAHVLSEVNDPSPLCNAPSEMMMIKEVAQPQAVCVMQKTTGITVGSYANGLSTAIRFGQD